MATRALGRQFGWLWAAFAVSAYSSGFRFGAFGLIAIRVLHAGPAQVPLGPWIEFRRKRPVMIGMDLSGSRR